MTTHILYIELDDEPKTSEQIQAMLEEAVHDGNYVELDETADAATLLSAQDYLTESIMQKGE